MAAWHPCQVVNLPKPLIRRNTVQSWGPITLVVALFKGLVVEQSWAAFAGIRACLRKGPPVLGDAFPLAGVVAEGRRVGAPSCNGVLAGRQRLREYAAPRRKRGPPSRGAAELRCPHAMPPTANKLVGHCVTPSPLALL